MHRYIVNLLLTGFALFGLCSCNTAHVSAPPADLKLDPFYAKYLDCDGIVVISSDQVDDKAFYRLQDLLDNILANRPDLRQTLVDAGFRYIIVAAEEQITDVPEYAHMEPKAFWNQRARGFGGKTTSCGEENILNLPGDRYDDESILIHELAHGIHRPGLRNCDPSFQGKLDALYQQAMDKGLYMHDYAATNSAEYWAESVQAFFDCDRQNNWNHNDINTREELIAYDPDMATFVRDIFRITDDADWRYVPLNDLPLVQKADIPGSGAKFSKLVTFWDFSVVGTKHTPDTLMLQTADVVRSMFRYRYDILKTMIDSDVTLAVYKKIPSDAKDNQLDVDSFVTQIDGRPQSVLPDKFQIYTDLEKQHSLVHDLAIAAYFYTGLRPIDPTYETRKQKQQYEVGLDRIDIRFDQNVQNIYKCAMNKGLWQSTPASENRFEYFAHGVSLFFNAAAMQLSNGDSIRTREQLAQYDPDLDELISDIFKHPQRTDWRYAMSN